MRNGVQKTGGKEVDSARKEAVKGKLEDDVEEKEETHTRAWRARSVF